MIALAAAHVQQEKFEDGAKTAMQYQMSEMLSRTVEHPVVRVHPETGLKVNGNGVLRFIDCGADSVREFHVHVPLRGLD